MLISLKFTIIKWEFWDRCGSVSSVKTNDTVTQSLSGGLMPPGSGGYTHPSTGSTETDALPHGLTQNHYKIIHVSQRLSYRTAHDCMFHVNIITKTVRESRYCSSLHDCKAQINITNRFTLNGAGRRVSHTIASYSFELSNKSRLYIK